MIAAIGRVMPGLGDVIDAALTGAAGEPVPFVFIVAAGTSSVHVCNVNREDAIRLLEGQLAAWKSSVPDVPIIFP